MKSSDECLRCGGKRFSTYEQMSLLIKLSPTERAFIFSNDKNICEPCVVQLRNKYVIRTNDQYKN